MLGRTIAGIEVLHPRSVRRHAAGAEDFAARLAGSTVHGVRRRGKYLWLELAGRRTALLIHLGMSGQLLVRPGDAVAETHLRVRLTFADGGPELRFVDQRTFGGMILADYVDGGVEPLPSPVAHIATDPMDPAFDPHAAVTALRRRRTELKRALLDQTLVSGVGNIYADEALWVAGLHGSRSTASTTVKQGRALFTAVGEVMTAALAAGGTSFDALYVNVNGRSGYFSRSLAVYGQEGKPCTRCGTAIRRESFTNRSSYFCPRCQPRPRRRPTSPKAGRVDRQVERLR